jgi:hypothetical protein
MKPWRPYWKQLERMIDGLATITHPAPFRTLSAAGEWIGQLTFRELQLADDLIRSWALMPETIRDPVPHGATAEAVLYWQMVLRADCGMTFCRGELWKRSEFDWTQPPEKVFHWLLIELWRRDAPFWASRQFGSTPSISPALSRVIGLQKGNLN